jgi:hypothetical protein
MFNSAFIFNSYNYLFSLITDVCKQLIIFFRFFSMIVLRLILDLVKTYIIYRPQFKYHPQRNIKKTKLIKLSMSNNNRK